MSAVTYAGPAATCNCCRLAAKHAQYLQHGADQDRLAEMYSDQTHSKRVTCWCFDNRLKLLLLLAVALALPLDVHKICSMGLINEGWQDRAPNKSIVSESHVAIVTRKGNPKNIKSWDDLTR